ncbi:MAG: exodeoxyribonuclease V subunit beta [Planctomycetota bacterium]|nr:exodeoxyribonuclease V subunit beta [Planctomycetota bacterium]
MSPHVTPFSLEDAPLNQGTVLLEASAGTGKTYTITGVLVRMLLEGVIDKVEQALVVTFTVAAADELKNRLRAGVRTALSACEGEHVTDPFFAGLARHGSDGAARLRRALDDFDQAAVMTIHGFCNRLLVESAFECDQPFDLQMTTDEAPLLQNAAADALRSIREHDSPMFGALMSSAGLAPARLAQLFRVWRRHPGTLLEPEPGQLAELLDRLRAAVAAAATSWDDALPALVASFDWYKGEEPGRDAAAHLRQSAAQLHSQPELALAGLASFSTRRLRKTVQKKCREQLDEPFFHACEEVSRALEAATDQLRVDLLVRMEERLANIKREQAALTYDDLLTRSHHAVTCSPRRQELLASLRSRYAVALIDEFQDTDARQYEVLSAAFADRPLFLVGDPKQSIYAFRGADLRTYLEAAAGAGTTYTLGTNYRSSEQLVRAVNRLFSRRGAFVDERIAMHEVQANAKPSEKLLTDPDDGPALRFRTIPFVQDSKGQPKGLSPTESKDRIAADVAAEARRLLHGGACIDDKPVRPSDIAVLTRSNDEAERIQAHLRDAGIVAVIGKAGDVFDTDELGELVRVLQAILRPNDLPRARAALTSRIWGLDAPTIIALDQDEPRIEAELAKLDRWRATWSQRGFAAMTEQMLRELDVDARWLARAGGERNLTNLYQLCEMLHTAEHEQRLSPEALVEWIQHERAHSESVTAERRELRLESDEDAVQVLTMHSSKGLQFEIVFCPFLWTSRRAGTRDVPLPDATSDRPSQRTLRFRADQGDPAWRRHEADRLAEDVRLAYVALTRARRRCYVHWGPITHGGKGYEWSALGWLLDPNEGGVEAGWQTSWGSTYRASSSSMYADLERLAERAEGAIRVDSIESSGKTEPPPAPAAAAEVPATKRAPIPRRVPLAIHSFSSLVAGSEPGGHAHDVRDPAAPDAAPGAGIFGFARGAEAGQCLHTILEEVDLDDLSSAAARATVERTLSSHGLADPGAHPVAGDPAETVLANLRDLAAARACPAGPTVAALCRGPTLIEWKFTMPIGIPRVTELAAAFEEHGDDVARRYATRLRSLRPRELRGYLTGFADLIAEHEGRYWVIDWKSNHLGDRREAYDQAALTAAMEHHDYVLQYHLYVLAWHRHLRTRLHNYDYEEHFGGVCYAFLRGATPGQDQGMFYDRPPRALVEALDQWAKEEA